MQQAIYSSANINANSITGTSSAGKSGQTAGAPASGFARWAARHWDLAGVLALMGASAVYGAAALLSL